MEIENGTSTSSSAPDEYQVVHSSNGSWVVHAMGGIATACNLCDLYVHQQLKHEWDMEGKDMIVDQASFDDVETTIQIELYKKLLFDEDSIRIDDFEEEPATSSS